MRTPAIFITDRQRLTGIHQSARPVSMQCQAHPLQALNQLQLVMPPAAVNYNTLVINGENGSRWQVMFGDGNRVSTVDLAHYHVHADIGHRVFNLMGILPDAIGIDLHAGAGINSFSLSEGVNFIWHTRDDASLLPQVCLYKGANKGFVRGITSAGTDASVGGALLLAWASTYDSKNNKIPASNAWLANGYNWMGYDWSATVNVPTPYGFNASVSYFTSDWHLVHKDNTVWWGISLGASRSLQPTGKMLSQTWDIAKLLAGKTNLGLSWQEYYIIFGNGMDYLLDQRSRPTTSVDGWQWFSDENKAEPV